MTLEDHLADISRTPMLTCDEEIILGNQIQRMMQVLRDNKIEENISQTNLASSIQNLSIQNKKIVKVGLKARDRMILANMRLVVAVVKKTKTAQIHLSTQDLIQEGTIGLARAAEKFEPGRGYKFSTYAYWWIKQGIIRATEYQEKAIRVPPNVQKLDRQIKDARLKLSIKLDREPTISEIADNVGESIEKIKKTMSFSISMLSLDSIINSGDSHTELIEFIPADTSEETDNLEEISVKLDLILQLISALPENEQNMVKQKYGIGCKPHSTKEIAESNGISKQSARQQQQKIAHKIRYVAKVLKIDLCF